MLNSFLQVDHIRLSVQDRCDAEGWEEEEEVVFGVAPLHVCVFVLEQSGEVSAVTKKTYHHLLFGYF